MSSAPSIMGRLAEAAERFVSTRTQPEVLTGLETVLTEMAGVERFAILRPTERGWVAAWGTGGTGRTGADDAALPDDGDRRDADLLGRALVTYSIDVGRSRHILAILRLKAGCEFDGPCDRLVDFATYEAGRWLTRTAAA
jgi:hypothetical protein